MDIIKIIKSLPYIIITVTIIGIISIVLLGKTNVFYTTYIPLVFLALFMGSILLLYINKKQIEKKNYLQLNYLSLSQPILRKIFLLVLSILIIIVLFNLRDNPIYIVLVFCLVTLVILQILSKNPSTPWIFFELCFIISIIIFPFVLKSGYYYGGTDIIYHTHYINTIIQTGNLDALTETPYGFFPGLHLSSAIFSLLTSFSNNLSLYTFMILSFLGLSLFIYLISTNLFPSKLIGLIAIFISLSSELTIKLVSFYPFFYLSLLIIMLFYFIFKKDDNSKLTKIFLLIPITVSCLLAHHANQFPIIFIILTFLIIDWFIIPKFIKKQKKWIKKISLNIIPILIYLGICTLYLIYTYLNTGIALIKLIILSFHPTSASTSLSFVGDNSNQIVAIFSNSSHWLCIIPAIIAIYLILTTDKSSRKQYNLAFFMLFFFIFLTGISSVLPGINHTLPDRYYNIIFIFFSIGISFGLVILSSMFIKRKYGKKIGTIIITIFCLLISLSSCISLVGDNQIFQPFITINFNSNINNYFSYDEMAMNNFIINSSNSNIKIKYTSDPATLRYLQYNNNLNYEANNDKTISMFFTDILDNNITKIPNIYYRKNKHLKNQLYEWIRLDSKDLHSARAFTIPNDNQSISNFKINTQYYNIIYENGGNIIYEVF